MPRGGEHDLWDHGNRRPAKSVYPTRRTAQIGRLTVRNITTKGCRMPSTQTFREDRLVSFHEAPSGERTSAAKGLLIGLALSQVFWIGLAVLVF